MRINRFLSQCGLGSRRGVERLLLEGRVRVNGQVCRNLGTIVDTARDRVEVDGQIVGLPPIVGRVFLLHKPVGVVCSFRRQGRHRCLADVLPAALLGGRMFHVGRLDRDSTGLLLLSDDGDLAHRLLHPSRPVWKGYEVEVDLELAPPDLEAFRAGDFELDGRPCRPCRIEARGTTAAGARYFLELQEGRKRQIRRMFEAIGGRVLGLHRTTFGPIQLGDLRVGAVRPATEAEIQALRVAAGSSLSGAVDEGEGGH